ncbi:GNAT family N-acetyltransferase [Halanaerobiaceae bacterium Z-7014]|uniref:GNAT family N-acetyltransferase n=2 Tax=Halonatronomonas betaini TaxID=2778430 RepID=A0A931AQA6_9FIRM|nr:GNAT family N-acetyltransferase [Halonatronomonas betaini]
MIKYLTSLDGITAEQLGGFFVGWAEPLTPAEHLKALQNSEYIVLAFDTEKQKVVGFINALSDEINFAFIPMLEVLPEYQKSGIGKELINKMLGQLAHLGCIDLTCDQELQPYYEKFGMLRSHGMILRKHLNQRGE